MMLSLQAYRRSDAEMKIVIAKQVQRPTPTSRTLYTSHGCDRVLNLRVGVTKVTILIYARPILNTGIYHRTSFGRAARTIVELHLEPEPTPPTEQKEFQKPRSIHLNPIAPLK